MAAATSNETATRAVQAILERAVREVQRTKELLERAMASMKEKVDGAIKSHEQGYAIWTMTGGGTAFGRAAEEIEAANREYIAAIRHEELLRHTVELAQTK